MSSARGREGRLKDDYYVTPQWLIAEFLGHYRGHYELPESTLIHDPCAGGCAINEMSYPAVLERFGLTNIITSDIRGDSRALIKGDYLKLVNLKPDLVITNPPFDFSVPITMKAINESKTTIVLQRLNWIGSDWRKQFWKTSPLKRVYYEHNKRASFTPDGRTDSVEYAHFVFEKGFVGDTRFTLIL